MEQETVRAWKQEHSVQVQVLEQWTVGPRNVYTSGPRALAVYSADTVTRLMTNGAHNGFTSIPHTHRIFANGHRRRNWITERHHETTGTIGHRRKITEKALMN